MKIIEARFKDVCLTCTKEIKPGELIYWEKKVSHHVGCRPTVIGRWAGGKR